MKKWIDIFLNTGKSLLSPFFNVLLSVLIINYSGGYFWGQFVQHLILIGLALQIANWGNKDYLLREFSLLPAQINSIWLSNILNRSPVLFIFLILLIFFTTSGEEYMVLATWLCAGFIYQSTDAMMVYSKKFKFQIIAETTGFSIVLAAALYYNKNFHGLTLEKWFVLGVVIKLIVILLLDRKNLLRKSKLQFQPYYLLATFPFLAIGLSGMLQSKIDLYIVGWFDEKEALGTYQVIITLFIYIQAIAGFILTPFVKQVYRLNKTTLKKVSTKFMYLGTSISLIALPIIYFLITSIYHFELEVEYYIYGFLFVLPIFIYLPKVYSLYKIGMEKKVMYYNIVSTFVNAVLSFILLKTLGIKGVLLATAMAQWVLVPLYLLTKQNVKIDGA